MTSHRGVDMACVQVGDDVALLARADHRIVAGSEVALHEERGAPVAVLA